MHEGGQVSGRPIISDVRLKKAAEEFRIPLSARLIYNLLAMCLLKEEGLLDEFRIGIVSPGISNTAKMFTTETNARIANLALA